MPRPILTLVGQHGSAKSTVSMFLRRLLDPSRVELLGKDARADLPLVFFKHAVPAFDNIDGMTPNEADLCCQAVTGRGIARRMLYTDAEEFILSFQRAIIFNGLRLPTNRPDFLDRTLSLELERLPPEQRSLLEHLDGRFMDARPRLVGGLLNALSRTLAKLPQVSTEGLSRMADFHRMGRAVAEVLGYTASQFDEAIKAAEARQKRGAFDNTLALAILLFVRQTRHWQGDATQLLQRLHETAKANQIRQSPEFWPDTPLGLGRQIKHLGEALARHGVQVTRPRRAKARLICLEYDPETDSVGDED
jgi:GNAT superfamily N-acetyltransferase